MGTKYDRVDVPEDQYLHSDNEQNEEFGTGVYPISVISRKSGMKNKHSVEFACIRMKRSNFRFLLCASCVFVLILIIVIVVASKANKSKGDKIEEFLEKEPKEKGLLFQPSVEGSRVIRYSIKDMTTYHQYLQHLDFYMYDYSSIHQQGSDYVDCTNHSAPAGKGCRMSTDDFGHHCSHLNSYGYSQGRPCVLLMLKLDNGTVIEPFTDQDKEVKDLLKDRWSPDHVGITCEGETDFDKAAMGHEDFWFEDGVKERSISYHPPTGFPIWFYPQKNRFYKVPAVMVHFNTIRTYHIVTVKCTAWAKSFNGGKPQDSNIYSVRFQIYMD